MKSKIKRIFCSILAALSVMSTVVVLMECSAKTEKVLKISEE